MRDEETKEAKEHIKKGGDKLNRHKILVKDNERSNIMREAGRAKENPLQPAH